MDVDEEHELLYPALAQLKREVKIIMEESVMKKFISERSASVTALCVATEACLMHGVKCRLFGLLGSPTSSLSLLYRIADFCPPASSVLKMVVRAEKQCFENQKRSSFDKLTESPIALLCKQKQPANLRYLWIKLALFEKVLVTIVDYISRHARNFYDKGALMLDSTVGSMVAALLAGPCALDYSKAKTVDTYFSDPPADELLQRHRIHSKGAPNSQMFTGKSAKTLQIKRNEGLGPDEFSQKNSTLARDYVTSLHQNTTATLLYGKNNVCIYPSNNCNKPMKGYLSLHEQYEGAAIIKWMPNELVHSNSDPTDFFHTSNFWNHAICLNIMELVYIHVHNKGSDGGSVVFVGADGVQHAPVHFPPGQHPLAFISCIENCIQSWGQLDPPLWLQKGIGKIFPKLRRRSSDVHCKPDNVEDTKDYVFRIIRRKSCIPNGSCASSDRGFLTPATSSSEAASPTLSSSSRFERFSLRLLQRWRSSTTSEGTASTGTPSCGGSPTDTPSLATSSLTSPAPSSPRLAPSFAAYDATASCATPSEMGASLEMRSINDCVDYAGVPSEFPLHLFVTQTSSPAKLTSDDGESLARLTLKSACNSMRHQILSRAFCGWLAYCKNMSTIRTNLKDLVRNCDEAKNLSEFMSACQADENFELSNEHWDALRGQASDKSSSFDEFCRRVYLGGVRPDLRPRVWPYLLGLHKWTDDEATAAKRILEKKLRYENLVTEWMAMEAIARKKNPDAFRLFEISTASNGVRSNSEQKIIGGDPKKINETLHEIRNEDIEEFEIDDVAPQSMESMGNRRRRSTTDSGNSSLSSASLVSPQSIDLRLQHRENVVGSDSPPFTSITSSVAMVSPLPIDDDVTSSKEAPRSPQFIDNEQKTDQSGAKERPAYNHLLEMFSSNIQKIDKDVVRCDRHYPYFTSMRNLEKMRNIMCTYVWENVEVGYIQGMCDLAAPLLVVFDDEVLTYGCFKIVMNRLAANFPEREGMTANLVHTKSLLQIMDPELFELMQRNDSSTFYYFCFRWFLLDFKRELVYDDIFYVWETIWAARHVASSHFVLFIALAIMETYREVILHNNMDFTDITKFFGEMAEHHEIRPIISLARSFVAKLQNALE